jgi:hypothetical protein
MPEKEPVMVPQKHGLSCKLCKAPTASLWRGPGERWCSKYKCHQAATAARKALEFDKKDARIDELEVLIDKQADELGDLKERVRVLEKFAKQQLAVSDAPRASVRRPLGALTLNVQAQPQAAALKPPAKKARTEEAAPKLPPGWTSRPSSSQPGKTVYEHAKFKLRTLAAPTVTRKGEYFVDLDIARTLTRRAWEEADDDDTRPLVELGLKDFEQCMGLEPGTVKSTPELKTVYDAAMDKVAEEMEQEEMAALTTKQRDDVLRCFMGAQNLIGMDVATAQAALIAAGQGMGAETLRSAIDGLVREGELFSTIDEDTFAVTLTVDACVTAGA